MVFQSCSWFFVIVFSWVFQRTGNPLIFIVGHPSMNIDGYPSMNSLMDTINESIDGPSMNMAVFGLTGLGRSGGVRGHGMAWTMRTPNLG